MLRSILVGLDGSDPSKCAVQLGIEWARRHDALLVGLAVVDEPRIRQATMVPLGAGAFKEQADDARMHQATNRVEQFLEEFALACAAAGVSSKVLEDVGEPFEHIVREAQRYDLILLGKQTHFHFATQETPCDTLQKVLKNTPRPVLIAAEGLPTGKSILVAFDGSLPAARALQVFQGLGIAATQHVHVVTVGAERVEASRHADRAVEFLSFHGIQATAHLIAAAASPHTVLLEQVRRLNPALIVMGAYGQSAFKEFFLGSATRTFLKESPVPMLLYH